VTQDYVIQDSGKRQRFATGAVRDGQTGKGRFDLLPSGAVLRMARHFEKGAAKYGDRNWERGMPLSRFFDSALRHAFSYLGGDDEEDHLVAAAWNLLAALDIERRAREGDLPCKLLDIGPYRVSEREKHDLPRKPVHASRSRRSRTKVRRSMSRDRRAH
jgi:hypothetical protein